MRKETIDFAVVISTLVAGVAGAVMLWDRFAPGVWRGVLASRRLVARGYSNARKAIRVWRLCRGKRVSRPSIGEIQDAMERAGVDALHAEHRAELERAMKEVARVASQFRMPTFPSV